MTEKKKKVKIGPLNIPKYDPNMKPMKNDVILANGMSRNQVMKDPDASPKLKKKANFYKNVISK